MNLFAALFDSLFDDAAVFPPGNLPLAAAVPAHRAHHNAWYRDTVGPLVVPASQAGSIDVPMSVILKDGLLPEIFANIRAVETTVPGFAKNVPADIPGFAKKLPAGVLGYVEVPRDERRMSVLDALAGTGLRAKFRTGGAGPSDTPSDTELAEAIRAAVDRNIAFKCTAGLHHAIRGDQHGFLNVLIATDAARHGAGTYEISLLLAERSPDRVLERLAAVTPEVRDAFVSFGTCSIDEPIADLVTLGLLTPPGENQP